MTMAFAPDGSWEAWSRPDGVLPLISWRQRFFGRLLGKLPPRGALMYLTDGTQTASGDSVILRGTMQSPQLGTRRLVGSMSSGRIRADLRRGSDTGVVTGRVEAVPDSTTAPYRDYPGIVATARRAVAERIYDPRLAARADVVRFFERWARAAARAQDDLDLLASFLAALPALRISHVALIPSPRLASAPRDAIIAGDTRIDPALLVRLGFPAPGLAYLAVSRWDGVNRAVARAFARLNSAKTEVLILDIRGNPGGDASAIAPAAHLLADTVVVGAFLGRNWYAQHAAPPTRDEYGALPVVSSESPATEVFDLLETTGAVVGRALPLRPRFAGRVYVLTDGGTASASEVLAHVLKTTGRATIIGERTAGAMLTALPHPVGEGWVIILPEADFVAADGTRLEGRGVEPHLRSSSAEAPVRAAREIRKHLPFGGAVALGNAYSNLRRYRDAERAWTEALRLAPSQAARDAVEQAIARARRMRQAPSGRR